MPHTALSALTRIDDLKRDLAAGFAPTTADVAWLLAIAEDAIDAALAAEGECLDSLRALREADRACATSLEALPC